MIRLIAAILGIASIPAVSAIAQTPGGESEAARASLARADAEALLSHLPLREGAQLSSSDPSVGQALSDSFGFSSRPGPGLASENRFWRVPGEPQEVMAWIETHVPAGVSLFMNRATRAFRFAPRQPEAIYEEQLRFATAPAEGGGTAVRAEGAVVWFPLRPRSERVPSHAVKLIRVIEHRTHFDETFFSSSKTIRAPAVVKSVVAAVEALKRPATPLTGVRACGHTVRRTMLEVQFRGSSQAGEPLARLVIGNDGCHPSIEMWVGTRQEPELSSGPSSAEKAIPPPCVQLQFEALLYPRALPSRCPGRAGI